MEANKKAVLQISTKSVSKREGDQPNSAERREVTTVWYVAMWRTLLNRGLVGQVRMKAFSFLASSFDIAY